MKRILVAAIAVACLCGGTARAAEELASEKMGWKLALQCWTFNKLTFFETVDTAKKLGIKYLEAFPGQKLKPGSNIGMGPGMADDVIAEIKQKLDADGCKIASFGVCGANKGTFEWAKKLGIENLVTESGEKELPGLDKLCEEYKINIALHNHPKPSHYWNPETVLAGVKDVSKRVGACADTGHWMRSSIVPMDGVKKLEGKIVEFHFKDLNQMGGGHDVPWGTGKGDVKAVLAEIQRQGFKGVFSIEYEHGGGQELIDNVGKCVTFFEETCKELGKK